MGSILNREKCDFNSLKRFEWMMKLKETKFVLLNNNETMSIIKA